MSGGENPEDVAPAFGLEGYEGEVTIEGDTEEMLADFEERLQYLEGVWPTIDEDDPQQQVVALEIVALRHAVDRLEEEL